MEARMTPAERDELRIANDRLLQACRQLEQDAEAALRIQQRLLPAALPDLAPLQLAVHHRPCGRAGGDSYGAFPIDDDWIGIYLADAMGHGVTAALLTLFLKHHLEIGARHPEQALRPDRVLGLLNDALVELALPDVPFVSVIYAVVCRGDGKLQFARAGQPHPLYLSGQGPPEFWRAAGNLLGVFRGAFTVETRHLKPGDRVLLSSDGYCPPASLDRLCASSAAHQSLPLGEFTAQVAADLASGSATDDDRTLLGLEWAPATY